jgi:hypothetical protein
MRRVKGLMAAGLVSALLLVSASAQGGSVVLNESGGGSLMTVMGSSTGGTLVGNSFNIETFQINGVTGLNIPTSYNVVITDVGPPILGIQAITAFGTSFIGAVTGQQAELVFNNLTGVAYNLGTTGNIALTGTISSVPLDSYPGYTFDPSMVGASITLNVTKTDTNFLTVLGHKGAMAKNSGFGFQQADAAPEPASLILLGMGVGSLLVFRQVRRRISVVSEKG